MAEKLPVEQVRALRERHSRLVSNRNQYEGLWHDLRRYIRPETKAFGSDTSQGQDLRRQLYDGTATYANDQLASAIVGSLLPNVERMIYLTVEPIVGAPKKLSKMALTWLDEVGQTINSYWLKPASNSYSSMHEVCLDVSGLGTGIEHQVWDESAQALVFRPIPLADCWIDQDHLGRIDTLHRKVCWTKRQLCQQFGEDALPKRIRECKNTDTIFPIVHAVYPRTDRNPVSKAPTNKKYASVWFFAEGSYKPEECVVRVSGFDDFPYATPRFFKLSNEIYGRGPGAVCLPNVRYLQTLKKVNIRGKSKVIDPTLLVPNDGILTDIVTEPNSVIYYEPDIFSQSNRPPIQPLQTGARSDVADHEIGMEREFIMRCFYSDWVRRERKSERQTAVEILDEKDENVMMMLPNLARITTELLDRRVARSYQLLLNAGKFPEIPHELMGRNLKVTYQSPAVRAQRAQRSQNDRRFLEIILPLMQVDPTLANYLNIPQFVIDAAENLSVSPGLIRDKQEAEAMVQAQQQQQQLAAMAESALPASQAAKNMAQAQQAGISFPGA